MVFTLIKTFIFGGINVDVIKKLILPLILVLSIPLAGVFIYKKFENVQLENQKLTLEIKNLNQQIDKLTEVNKNNNEQLTRFQASCKNGIEELTKLYEAKQTADKKELDRYKKRKAKEDGLKDVKVSDSKGGFRSLTDEEMVDFTSVIRIDSMFEAYSNAGETK